MVNGSSAAGVAHTAIERQTMKQLLFKIGDAAKMLAISEGYLYELMSRNEIEYVKLGRKATRFTQKQLDDFIQQRVAKAERRKKKSEFTVN